MPTKKKQPAFRKANVNAVPIRCSKDFIDKMCNFLRIGAYVETAAVMAGVPKATFYDWIRKGHKQKQGIYRELLTAVDKAVAEGEVRDLMVIDKTASGADWEYEKYPEGATDETGQDISGNLMLNGRGNPIVKKIGHLPNWSASAWRLERRHPKHWSQTSIQKLEHSGKVAGPQIIVKLPSNGREAKK